MLQVLGGSSPSLESILSAVSVSHTLRSLDVGELFNLVEQCECLQI